MCWYFSSLHHTDVSILRLSKWVSVGRYRQIIRSARTHRLLFSSSLSSDLFMTGQGTFGSSVRSSVHDEKQRESSSSILIISTLTLRGVCVCVNISTHINDIRVCFPLFSICIEILLRIPQHRLRPLLYHSGRSLLSDRHPAVKQGGACVRYSFHFTHYSPSDTLTHIPSNELNDSLFLGIFQTTDCDFVFVFVLYTDCTDDTNN